MQFKFSLSQPEEMSEVGRENCLGEMSGGNMSGRKCPGWKVLHPPLMIKEKVKDVDLYSAISRAPHLQCA